MNGRDVKEDGALLTDGWTERKHRHTQAYTTRKSESDREHSSHRHTQTITERAETQRDAHRETHT